MPSLVFLAGPIAGRRYKLIDLDEQVVKRYLRHRGGRQSIQPGDRAALKRWLSVLREELGLSGILAEMNCGSQIPHERVLTSLQLLCEDVIPKFK